MQTGENMVSQFTTWYERYVHIYMYVNWIKNKDIEVTKFRTQAQFVPFKHFSWLCLWWFIIFILSDKNDNAIGKYTTTHSSIQDMKS